MSKGKINVYICGTLDVVSDGDQQKVQLKEGKHRTITIDRDEGTTPFMIGCRHPRCDKTAYSSFYPDHAQLLHPTHQWYAPARRELKKLRKTDPATYDHCTKGGLILRELTGHEQKEIKSRVPVRR